VEKRRKILCRTLVVDDDDAVQPLTSSFVDKQGHEAICTSTGEEALERMDTHLARRNSKLKQDRDFCFDKF
jgi:CheY-like chemotaxis protein